MIHQMGWVARAKSVWCAWLRLTTVPATATPSAAPTWRLVVPEDVDIVVYCSSKNEITSARVADALRKRGFEDVWVLEGGLDAWVLEGRPVTTALSTPEEVAARMGIVIPTA